MIDDLNCIVAIVGSDWVEDYGWTMQFAACVSFEMCDKIYNY